MERESLVVFGDYRRKAPCVRLAKGSEFHLLLNAHNDLVRIRPSWDPARDAADVVAVMRRSADSTWFFQLHENSPLRKVHLVTVDIPSRTSRIMRMTSDICSRSCGEILHFAVILGNQRRDFRMAVLAGGDLGNRGSSAADDSEALLLTDLPLEMLHLILRRVPLPVVVHVLPLVSAKMFDIVKSFEYFPWLDVRDLSSMCSADAEELCTRARRSCEVLCGPEDQRGRYLLHPDVLRTILVHFSWPLLVELHLVGNVRGFSPDVLHHALRKGNFSSLEVLVVNPEQAAFGWRYMVGAKLPKLKSLTLGVEEEEAPVFSLPFLKLENLQVTCRRLLPSILPKVSGDQGPNGVIFPELKRLRVCANANRFHPESFGSKFACCRSAPIEELMLMESSIASVESRRHPLKINSGVLFRIFPRLKTLELGNSYGLVYEDSFFVKLPLAQLRNLVISVANLDESAFPHLTGIEHLQLRFDVPDEDGEQAVVAKLKSLLCLPALVDVSLWVVDSLSSLLTLGDTTVSVVHFLVFERPVLLDAGVVAQILRVFSNVRDVTLHQCVHFDDYADRITANFPSVRVLRSS